MARFNDWVALADSTFRTLQTRDVTELYSLEWPEAKKALIAEHWNDIERDPKRARRFIRMCSAVVYGLAKRLTPQRRVLFFAAQFAAILALMTFFVNDGSQRDAFWVLFGIVAAPVFLTLILGMELIDKIRFRDELELARDLQARLIPQELPQIPGYGLAAYNRIANTVGGDIYDFVPLPDGRLAILFGDASGHGMAAGLVMAVAHAAFRTQLDVDPSPDAMFATLNRILCRTGGSRSFFAGVYFLIDPQGRFETKVAGHPPVLKIDSRGNVRASIGQGAYPLGIKTTLEWPTETGTLQPQEILVFHSDGLIEARNAADEEMGEDFVEGIIRSFAGRSADEILGSMVREYLGFIGRRAPDDDVSIAVLKRISGNAVTTV